MKRFLVIEPDSGITVKSFGSLAEAEEQVRKWNEEEKNDIDYDFSPVEYSILEVDM